MVELLDMRCFEALADELHFGHAADRLGLSQPSLSRRIRRLEDHLGIVLLHRTSRVVTLTSAGRDLAASLPAALRQLDRALSSAQHPNDGGWEV